MGPCAMAGVRISSLGRTQPPHPVSQGGVVGAEGLCPEMAGRPPAFSSGRDEVLRGGEGKDGPPGCRDFQTGLP